jgi:hypothetical protein
VVKIRALVRRHAAPLDRPFRASFIFDRHNQGVALGRCESRRWRSRSAPQRGISTQPRATPRVHDFPFIASPERAV